MDAHNAGLAQQLAPFFEQRDDWVNISAPQGSGFAKQIAGDHNPIHDIDAPRFCVPGDLLFALVVSHYGLSHRMQLAFKGMLRADTPLKFPPLQTNAPFGVADESGKAYVEVSHQGRLDVAGPGVWALVAAYVGWSGQTFPDLLQPLLARHGVMFNPRRPFVVYDRMTLALDEPPDRDVSLELEGTTLEVSGKRGDAAFRFVIRNRQTAIGECEKRMVISGLRDYDDVEMTAMIEAYRRRRTEAMNGS
jgi:hypothetical protein